ncbi:gamma-aminobutyric acid type B receptor subunit 2-like [Dendronephthya gigantea]|uniref:gamma-aminobutyric acid type B receptor subunit 2-like n=1 Tax=Dendronephthya gigantea TaxID=151771 RepID=UPI00106924CC|nr:gamma-aminobutyric acid type B receptor subunit 2-like [Dendronephthya gigantea]XP_028407397.1 gamma-aminobutyric acid type B receptor subunit 2-like [Dendronephthya gigantea]
MLLIFLTALVGCVQITQAIPKHKIYIGCLVPSFNRDFYGYEAAINLAAEMINNRTDILPNHEMVMLCEDTYGNIQYTIYHVFSFLQLPANQSIRLLIGPAWSKTTVAASQASRVWQIVQLSYAASSVEFQNSVNYNILFTNVPSTSAFNKAKLELTQYFGWKRIAILREYDDKLHAESVRDLRDQIVRDNLNISLITIEGFSRASEGHPRMQLENLKRLDARIIIGEFTPYGAVEVFCEAYKMGMISPKYVWLLSASLSGSWIFSPGTFSSRFPGSKCNISEIIESADSFIISDKVPIRADKNETLSRLTPESFMAEMRKRNKNAQSYVSYAFDCVWAAALLFQATLSLPKTYHPENAKFRSLKVREAYVKNLAEVEFQGMTGPHHFDGRQRLGTVRINQMRNVNGKAELVQVGSLASTSKKDFQMTLFENQINKLWKDGKIPVDETRKERKIMTYSIFQLAVIWILAVLGLFYSIFFFHFNISKRKHKVVRMSSPMINNVVLLGCFFCYVFVFLLGIDSRFVNDHVLGILCNVRLYVLSVAFSMSFGALFSKTWRVHKIFTAQRAIKKKLMRDFHLLLFVLALVVIDVIFITMWVYYDPLETKEIIFDKIKDDSGDLITIPVLKICECTHRTKLLGALYGYKGILLLFGVFLAWETRNVTIPALNDSKYIGMSVYNVVILSAIGATVSMVLKKTVYFELLHVLVSAVVVLSTTVALTMVFAPKVYEYYLLPPEPQERTRTMETLQMSMTSTTTTEASDVYEVYVKTKDVKHKWIQTDDFEEVNSGLITASPAPLGQNGATVVDNGIHEDRNDEMVTSEGNDESQFREVHIQDEERILMASGVYIGLCNDSMRSPMAVRNEGFSENTEDAKEQNGLNGD